MEKNVIQTNGGIIINAPVSVKNVMVVKKIMFGIQLHVIKEIENIQQLLCMIQQLTVMKLWDDTMEKQILRKREEPAQNFYILIAFLLITVASLIAVSI